MDIVASSSSKSDSSVSSHCSVSKVTDQGDEEFLARGVSTVTKEALQQEPCHLQRLEAFEFTNGLVVHLRRLHGSSSADLLKQLKQLAPFEVLPDVEKCKDDSIGKCVANVWKKYQDKNRNLKKDRERLLPEFLKTQFQLPKPREPPSTASTSSVVHKLQQTRKDLKESKKRRAQSEHEAYELERRYESLTQEYYSAVAEMHRNADSFRNALVEKSAVASDLSEELSAANKQNAELRAKLDSLEARLEKIGTVRNANKRVRRRDVTIDTQKETIHELQGVVSAGAQELSELREAYSAAEESNAGAAEKVAKLNTKVKSLQDSRRKLENKMKRQEENKLKVQKDLQATVDHLQDKLRDLKDENTELQQVESVMESKKVKTFYGGRYCDEIREVVMELLTSGVSMNKVDGVISTVLEKLAGMTVDRFPSKGSKSRLLAEARILAQVQVAKAIVNADRDKGNCLHQDGTSKFFKKYQTFDVTLPSGKTLTMSMTEVPSGDAEGIMTAFSESCKELAEVLCEPGEDVAKKTAEVMTSFTSTMSDRGATNPLFNKHLEEMRRELLPAVEKEWETLADDVKDELGSMCNYFCKMHLLVNFATEANSTLKIFEDAVSEGTNPFAFSQQGESGAARLIRTACSAFTDHGNEKSGAPQYFKSHLSHHHQEEKNWMVAYRGNRFNILFYDAAAVYHHHKQIVSFVSSWPDPNGLLKAVKADASQKVYLAGVRALGILDKTVTGPFFRILGMEKKVLSMNQHLHQMQIGLERWSRDASTLLAGEPLFNETVVARHKDALFDSLFAATGDEDLDVLTQQALEVVCSALLILLERQAEEQLPGGQFWQPTETEVKRADHVPTTNVVSERDFAIVDNLIRAKPNATSLSLEAYLLWMNNETSDWLRSLSPEDKKKHMDYARTNAGKVHERFKEKNKAIKEKRLQTLMERQKEKEEKRKRARMKKVVLTEKVVNMGGVWRTPEEIDEKIGVLKQEKEKLDALKFQLQFHKQVLKSEGAKENFQMTITRPGKKKHTFSSEEKVLHLKEIVLKNMAATTDVEIDSEEEEDDQEEYVTLKEPEARSLQEMHAKLNDKLQDAREKREVKKQKETLPEYLMDPSKLVGRRVKHKCFTAEKEAKWYPGTVTKIVNRTEDTKNTKYHIVYDDESEPDEIFPLLVDLGKGWLMVE
ncbi:uncharacterized protein [Branchiostoma lanceolatum]|uniref:uncharacterized protein n=1 Tax=Branchiostoma lanceolatum TaxID=7740 RepID=UPI003451D30F